MSGENDSDSESEVLKKVNRIYNFQKELIVICQLKRLKAAIHFAVGQTCQEIADKEQISFQKKVLAVMTEAAWKYSEMMARDLELFAQHARRNTISVEDVKMVARKSPKLVRYIQRKILGIPYHFYVYTQHKLMTERANEISQKKKS